MGLSKENRILILLVIDTAFFLLELITGGLSMDFDPERAGLSDSVLSRLYRPLARPCCRFLSHGTRTAMHVPQRDSNLTNS
jgi:hypothetical protein